MEINNKNVLNLLHICYNYRIMYCQRKLNKIILMENL